MLDKAIQDMIAQAVKHGPDMRRAAQKEYEIPASGIARARFIGYFEVGKHDEEFNGQFKTREKVLMIFELSGPNHPPRDINGEKHPQRITVTENLEMRPDSHFIRLFRQMNHAGKARHIVQLLGEPFLVEIFHMRSADGERTFANLRGYDGYNIKGTTVYDAVDRKLVTVDVPPAMTDIRLFLWEFADREAWDSIYIPGEYPERKDERTGEVITPAKSKNVLQEKIMSARNWPEHPLYEEVRARPSVAVEWRGGVPVRPEGQSVQEWQDENWRRLMEALGRPAPSTRSRRKPRGGKSAE
jgi:hypothetical protein